MTGIAGLYCADGADPATLKAMTDAIADRGQDGAATWLSNASDRGRSTGNESLVGLGASLLRVTSEAQDETQPHCSEDRRIALVFDGFLINWEELRADLLRLGVVLRNRTDTELVLRAYQQWGEDCARHLDGEFALALTDCRSDPSNPLVYCARDHMGLRPLFYHFDGQQLLFASDLSALVPRIEPKPRPDLDYLAGVMADKWHQRDATPWQGIKRLLPAHSLSFSANRLTLKEHWSLDPEVTTRYPRDEDYFEHYRHLLKDCVRRTSRSHGPLGVTVSGGLDSSALYCLAYQLAERGELPAPSISGYTLAGASGSPAYELPFARAAAEHVGAQLCEVPLTQPPIDWFTEQARTQYDLPIPTNGAMSIGLENAAAADGCRALMGGDGGDEWLQGSRHYYREFTEAGDVAGFARALRQDAAAEGWRQTLPIALRHMTMTLLPEIIRDRGRDYKRQKARERKEYLDWLTEETRHRLAEFEDSYVTSLPSEPVRWSKLNLVRAPGTDMANTMMQGQYARAGLEPRNPMLSKAFIEFSASTPEHIRRRAGHSKYIHRRALRGIVPDVILDRTTKADFPSPELDREFADFARKNADPLLDNMCDEAGFQCLLRPDASGTIPDERSWEVWGVYACAAFLYHFR